MPDLAEEDDFANDEDDCSIDDEDCAIDDEDSSIDDEDCASDDEDCAKHVESMIGLICDMVCGWMDSVNEFMGVKLFADKLSKWATEKVPKTAIINRIFLNMR